MGAGVFQQSMLTQGTIPTSPTSAHNGDSCSTLQGMGQHWGFLLAVYKQILDPFMAKDGENWLLYPRYREPS